METRQEIIEDGKGNVIETDSVQYDPAPTLKAQAQASLDRSDMVALRCFKAAVSFPQTWQDYVTSLRAIINSGTGMIPDQPAYPEGT